MQALPKLKPTIKPSKEGAFEVSASIESSEANQSDLNLDSSDQSSEEINPEYLQLQLRIFSLATLLTAFAVLIAVIFFDAQTAISFLLGAFCGMLYLRLLARGIGKLGKTTTSVSKVQLLVPVLLFFLASRFPQLELWPSLLGFLIYKPSLIVQYLLEP